MVHPQTHALPGDLRVSIGRFRRRLFLDVVAAGVVLPAGLILGVLWSPLTSMAAWGGLLLILLACGLAAGALWRDWQQLEHAMLNNIAQHGLMKGRRKRTAEGIRSLRRRQTRQRADAEVRPLSREGTLSGSEAEQAELSTSLQGHGQPVAEVARQARVLLVEDNPLTQQALSQQLSSLDYAVTVVSNGLEALRTWRQGHFDLVLTDCEMPEYDGYLLMAKIRAEEAGLPRHTPIVVCTSHQERSDIDHCIRSGADDVICKPVFRETLKQRLDRWLAADVPYPSDDENAPEAKQVHAGSEHPASAPVLDRERAFKVLGDDPDFHLKLCQRFIAQGRDAVISMDHMIESDRLQAVAALAHKLRSSAASVGAQGLVLSLEGLGEDARRGDVRAARQRLQALIGQLDALELEAACLTGQGDPFRHGQGRTEAC